MEVMVRSATPESLADVKPDAKPISVFEGDRFIPVRHENGGVTPVERRVRVATLVHPTDANKRITVLKVMGPPTGEQGVFIPCDGEVEMAHVHELLDAAIERRRTRAAARALLLPEKNASFQAAIREAGEDGVLRLKGHSTFGPGGQTTRESHG